MLDGRLGSADTEPLPEIAVFSQGSRRCMSSARQPDYPGWRACLITIQNGTSKEPVTLTRGSLKSILLPLRNSVQFNLNLAVPNNQLVTIGQRLTSTY